jgi:hypothetical protein
MAESTRFGPCQASQRSPQPGACRETDVRHLEAAGENGEIHGGTSAYPTADGFEEYHRRADPFIQLAQARRRRRKENARKVEVSGHSLRGQPLHECLLHDRLLEIEFNLLGERTRQATTLPPRLNQQLPE